MVCGSGFSRAARVDRSLERRASNVGPSTGIEFWVSFRYRGNHTILSCRVGGLEFRNENWTLRPLEGSYMSFAQSV